MTAPTDVCSPRSAPASPLADYPQSNATPRHPVLDRRWFRQLEHWLGQYSSVGDRVFFAPAQFPWVKTLEANWATIRAEVDQLLANPAALPNYADISPRQQRIAGDGLWKTYFFSAFDYVVQRNCDRCPQTWALIKDIPGLKVAFFSILAPGKHIPEHRGKYKGLIRYHLGLKVPTPAHQCRIRVHDQIVPWAEGASLIFDDTYYHEVWNDTDDYRVVLFLDIARPFYWPLNWLNEAIFWLAGKSQAVAQAKASHAAWEQHMTENDHI